MVYELLLDQIKSWITGENKIAEDLDEDDDEDYGEQAEDVGRLAELLISTEEWNETRWRQTGHNSNRRGAGTGRSTHFVKLSLKTCTQIVKLLLRSTIR